MDVTIKKVWFKNYLSSLHISSGRAPHTLQDSPSWFMSGLLLAHVPANSPSFLAHILMAIPKTPNANNPMENSTNFIMQR